METPPPVPPPLPGASPVIMTAPAQPARLGDSAGMRMLLPVGRSGWAIAAGYMGLFGLVIIPAPLALIISIVAIRDIRKSKGTANPKHGMGRAIFGLLVGLFGTGLMLYFAVKYSLSKQ